MAEDLNLKRIVYAQFDKAARLLDLPAHVTEQIG